MKPLMTVLSLPFLTAALGAQSLVSPSFYANAESPGSLQSLFAPSYRWQQLHPDLKGAAHTLKSLSFRRDGMWVAGAGYESRPIECEVKLGTGVTALSTTFVTNLQSNSVTVMPKKLVNSPDWRQQPAQQPPPFTFELLFDVPYNYGGTANLMWELVTTQNNAAVQDLPVELASSANDYARGQELPLGAGCTTANGTYTLTGSATAMKANNSLTIGWPGTGAPGNASSAVMVGVPQAALTVPGLCTKLYVQPTLSYATITGPTGIFSGPLYSGTFMPSWVGITLAAQAASVDASQAGMPVAASNGVQVTIPGMPPAISISRCSGPLQNSTGSVTTGYGIVVRFAY